MGNVTTFSVIYLFLMCFMCVERTGNSSWQRCLLSWIPVTVDNQRIKIFQCAEFFQKLKEIETCRWGIRTNSASITGIDQVYQTNNTVTVFMCCRITIWCLYILQFIYCTSILPTGGKREWWHQIWICPFHKQWQVQGPNTIMQ